MSRWLVHVSRWINSLSTVGLWISTAAVIIVMIGVVADVLLRAFGGYGVRGMVEYGEILMVIIVFLALGYAQKTQSHVAVEVLVERVRPQTSKIIQIFVLLLMAAVSLWAAFYTADAAAASIANKEFRFGLVSVPTWPARIAIPLGFLILGLQSAKQVLNLVSSKAATSTGIETEGK